jgi:site-specific DNA recombinase
LAEALTEPATAAEAGDVLRGLIERIVLTPADASLAVEVAGELTTLAAFADPRGSRSRNAASNEDAALLSVVAGVGFEPTTFRL